MNISILYYNLFIGNPKLFNEIKDKIENKKNKKDLENMEIKEENKAEIISKFMYHLKLLFEKEKEITYDNILFLMILFNNLYTSSEDDLKKFMIAMYNKD